MGHSDFYSLGQLRLIGLKNILVLLSLQVFHASIGTLKKIVSKHWNVLKNDRMLGTTLPERQNVVFHDVLSLRLQVAPNILDAPNRVSFFQKRKGYFPCRKCSVCSLKTIKNRRVEQFKLRATVNLYNIDTFITCTSLNVVSDCLSMRPSIC